jgi:hypothetical protein
MNKNVKLPNWFKKWYEKTLPVVAKTGFLNSFQTKHSFTYIIIEPILTIQLYTVKETNDGGDRQDISEPIECAYLA